MMESFCPRSSRANKQYAIKRSDDIYGVALDYSYPEERDIDRLELNFIRWAKHFERDRGREKAPIMTAFVGEIRGMLDRAAKKRGSDRLMLGARVPSTMNECFLAGLDVTACVKRGYFDYIIPSEHNCAWPGLNVEQFVAAAAGTGCKVYAHMNDMVGCMWTGKPEPEGRGVAKAPTWTGYHSMMNTPEEARAAAYNFYSWGAQGIGFWNIPNNCNPGYGKPIHEGGSYF